MAIELEMPADMDNATWTTEGETASTAAADQAVGLLEADTELEAADEGSETEGLDGETISISGETIDQVDETIVQEPEAIQQLDVAAENLGPVKTELSATELFTQELREIADELATAVLRRMEVEARYKEAKNEEKVIAKRLEMVANRGPQKMPLFDQQNKKQPSGQDAAESVAPDAQTWAESGGPVVIEPLTDDAWRSVHISQLQLKPKLQERLEEAGVDTIGRLEDLRGEISQGREKWPKGIGKAKITEIEDAVIAWLSKNRDAQVLAEAKAQVQAETVQDEAAEPSANVEETEFDPCARAVELEEQGLIGYEHPEGNGYWKSGFDAYNQDAKVSECPYVAGPEADDWICGWLSAAKADQYHHKYDKTNDSVEAASIDDL